MQNVLSIIFIWLGTNEIHRPYIETLRKCSMTEGVTCTLLTEPHWDIYSKRYLKELNMSESSLNWRSGVVRADILRYMYLHAHGGVYSDLDNIIDY